MLGHHHHRRSNHQMDDAELIKEGTEKVPIFKD